jgi:hypothetical protein
MKFLSDTQIQSLISAGRKVEQMKNPYVLDDIRVVEYVSIYIDRGGVIVLWHSINEDIGDEDYIDVYSFPGIDPDSPYGERFEFESIKDALERV